eukprot:CAMPEP_0206291826 /NCGR_PEP_ID=MMETSP0106_2-20121207/3316_1 /ASSEMBLY_ACC=CAM_ASM_000206 /TAXON_ID=81532 /ORGANISM="Acanthoeca-like sp., Strain 10tr" /LENGTH=1870 /DNA_ID=CAMNT_0053722391 /DNA_START=54 /DNA_END=5666 /DNA_ORIENTATION=+
MWANGAASGREHDVADPRMDPRLGALSAQVSFARLGRTDATTLRPSTQSWGPDIHQDEILERRRGIMERGAERSRRQTASLAEQEKERRARNAKALKIAATTSSYWGVDHSGDIGETDLLFHKSLYKRSVTDMISRTEVEKYTRGGPSRNNAATAANDDAVLVGGVLPPAEEASRLLALDEEISARAAAERAHRTALLTPRANGVRRVDGHGGKQGDALSGATTANQRPATAGPEGDTQSPAMAGICAAGAAREAESVLINFDSRDGPTGSSSSLRPSSAGSQLAGKTGASPNEPSGLSRPDSVATETDAFLLNSLMPHHGPRPSASPEGVRLEAQAEMKAYEGTGLAIESTPMAPSSGAAAVSDTERLPLHSDQSPVTDSTFINFGGLSVGGRSAISSEKTINDDDDLEAHGMGADAVGNGAALVGHEAAPATGAVGGWQPGGVGRATGDVEDPHESSGAHKASGGDGENNIDSVSEAVKRAKARKAAKKEVAKKAAQEKEAELQYRRSTVTSSPQNLTLPPADSNLRRSMSPANTSLTTLSNLEADLLSEYTARCNQVNNDFKATMQALAEGSVSKEEASKRVWEAIETLNDPEANFILAKCDLNMQEQQVEQAAAALREKLENVQSGRGSKAEMMQASRDAVTLLSSKELQNAEYLKMVGSTLLSCGANPLETSQSFLRRSMTPGAGGLERASSTLSRTPTLPKERTLVLRRSGPNKTFDFVVQNVPDGETGRTSYVCNVGPFAKEAGLKLYDQIVAIDGAQLPPSLRVEDVSTRFAGKNEITLTVVNNSNLSSTPQGTAAFRSEQIHASTPARPSVTVHDMSSNDGSAGDPAAAAISAVFAADQRGSSSVINRTLRSNEAHSEDVPRTNRQQFKSAEQDDVDDKVSLSRALTETLDMSDAVRAVSTSSTLQGDDIGVIDQDDFRVARTTGQLDGNISDDVSDAPSSTQDADASDGMPAPSTTNTNGKAERARIRDAVTSAAAALEEMYKKVEAMPHTVLRKWRKIVNASFLQGVVADAVSPDPVQSPREDIEAVLSRMLSTVIRTAALFPRQVTALPPLPYDLVHVVEDARYEDDDDLVHLHQKLCCDATLWLGLSLAKLFDARDDDGIILAMVPPSATPTEMKDAVHVTSAIHTLVNTLSPRLFLAPARILRPSELGPSLHINTMKILFHEAEDDTPPKIDPECTRDLARLVLQTPMLLERLVRLSANTLDSKCADALVTVSRHEQYGAQLMEICARALMQQPGELSVIVRGTSAALRCMVSMLKQTASGWLGGVLGPLLTKIAEEVDVLNPQGTFAKANPEKFKRKRQRAIAQLLQGLIVDLAQSVNLIPAEARAVCFYLRRETALAHPGMEDRALRALVFLRFIQPAIGMPSMCGLPSIDGDIGLQKAHIEFLNEVNHAIAPSKGSTSEFAELIECNQRHVVHFLDVISSFPGESVLERDAVHFERPGDDPGDSLNTLADILAVAHKELVNPNYAENEDHEIDGNDFLFRCLYRDTIGSRNENFCEDRLKRRSVYDVRPRKRTLSQRLFGSKHFGTWFTLETADPLDPDYQFRRSTMSLRASSSSMRVGGPRSSRRQPDNAHATSAVRSDVSSDMVELPEGVGSVKPPSKKDLKEAKKQAKLQAKAARRSKRKNAKSSTALDVPPTSMESAGWEGPPPSNNHLPASDSTIAPYSAGPAAEAAAAPAPRDTEFAPPFTRLRKDGDILTVTILSCTNLVSPRGPDVIVSPCVDVQAWHQDKGITTKVCGQSNNPVFNERFDIVLDDAALADIANGSVDCTVFDDAVDGSADLIIGVAKIPLSVLNKGSPFTDKYPILDLSSNIRSGVICVRVEWTSPTMESQSQASQGVVADNRVLVTDLSETQM